MTVCRRDLITQNSYVRRYTHMSVTATVVKGKNMRHFNTSVWGTAHSIYGRNSKNLCARRMCKPPTQMPPMPLSFGRFTERKSAKKSPLCSDPHRGPFPRDAIWTTFFLATNRQTQHKREEKKRKSDAHSMSIGRVCSNCQHQFHSEIRE